jgi:hypothetical protein
MIKSELKTLLIHRISEINDIPLLKAIKTPESFSNFFRNK